MGAAQIAAHQIGLQLWEFTALLLDSFAIAAQSLVGAALGGVRRRPAPGDVAWQVARWGGYAGLGFGALFAAAWVVLPEAVHLGRRRAAPGARAVAVVRRHACRRPGCVFALDGVLIGAGDVAFMRTITIVAAVGVFAPLNVAALHWHWGIGGVWAGLTAFVLVRLVGMVARTRGHAGWCWEWRPAMPDGLVIVDKPPGLTSHDVVARMRRLAGTRKVGHAGTLDPMATGVLVIGVGRATRLLQHLVLADKEYAATIRLGQIDATPTTPRGRSSRRPRRPD